METRRQGVIPAPCFYVSLALRIICNRDFSRYYFWRILRCNRVSKLLEKLEDRIEKKCGSWYERNKEKLPVYIPLTLLGWYVYGMFVNSLRLGIEWTFHSSGEEVTSIWVLNPFKNWLIVFTPFGLATTAVTVLLICLSLQAQKMLLLVETMNCVRILQIAWGVQFGDYYFGLCSGNQI